MQQPTQIGEEGGKKVRKHHLTQLLISVMTANCAEIFFIKAATCPLSQRTAISLVVPVLPPALARVGGTISQQMQPRHWDLSQKPGHVIFLEATAFIFSIDGQHSLMLFTNSQG